MNLSVVIITFNEEANLGRTLASVKALVVDGKGEIIVVDSGSTDRTVEIAKSFGAKVFVEQWKGFAAQKNSAIDKATGDWILSLDADEELDHALQQALQEMFETLNRLSSLGKQATGHSSATEGAAFEARGLLARPKAPPLPARKRQIREPRSPRGRGGRRQYSTNPSRRSASPLLPYDLRLHRAYEPLLVAGS